MIRSLALLYVSYWSTICVSQSNVTIQNTTDVILLKTQGFVQNYTENGNPLGCSMCNYVDSINTNENYNFISEWMNYQMVSDIYDDKFNHYNQQNNNITNQLPFIFSLGVPKNFLNFKTCTSPLTNDIILCYYHSMSYKPRYFECYIFYNSENIWSKSINITYYPGDDEFNTMPWFISLLCLYNGNYLLFTTVENGTYPYITSTYPFYYNIINKNGELITNNKNIQIKTDDILLCSVPVLSSFNESFMLFCNNNSGDYRNWDMLYIKGTYNLNNDDIYFNKTLYKLNVSTSPPPNNNDFIWYTVSNKFFWWENNIGFYPISINITDSCCYFIPYSITWSNVEGNYNSSYWFTIIDSNGNSVLNGDQDVLIIYQQPNSYEISDLLPEIEIIDLNTMLYSTEYYYFMVIYAYYHSQAVYGHHGKQSIIGVVYSLDKNGNLQTLKRISFIDSILAQGAQIVNQFCVNILNNKILSLTWTSIESNTSTLQYVYGQSWQIRLD